MSLHIKKDNLRDILVLYRSDINPVLSQVPLKVKKKFVRILESVIDGISWDDIDWELQDLEHELFPEQYKAWDPNLPNYWNNTYPEWKDIHEKMEKISRELEINNQLDEEIRIMKSLN